MLVAACRRHFEHDTEQERLPLDAAAGFAARREICVAAM
jgi:hypothetical protein